MDKTEVKVKFQRVANAVVTSFVVGVSPVLSTRCRELYGTMYRRLQCAYKHHSAAAHKNKVSYNELILGLIVFLLVLNGVLFTKVVTSHNGKALEADHIRNFRRTFPNSRGQCTQGYELNTLGNRQPSFLGKTRTLLRNLAFRLATGRSVHMCRECVPGSSKSRGARSCALCSPGYYQPGRGAGYCARCPVGSHQTSSGAVACLVCPAGFHQPSKGGTDCIECPEFTYQPQDGSSECIPCRESVQSVPYHGEVVDALLEGIARVTPLSCAMDRRRQDQPLHETLISEEEEQSDGEGGGGYFSGFFPDFDKLSGLLNDSSGGGEVKEEGDVDVDVIVEQVIIAEDQGSEECEEPTVKPEDIRQEDDKDDIDIKEEEISSDPVEAVDETSKLESDLPVEDVVFETDDVSTSEDDDKPLEDSDTDAGEVIEFNDEAAKTDSEPLLDFDVDNTVMQNSFEEKTNEIVQSLSPNNIEVHEMQEGDHLKVEESDDLDEDEVLYTSNPSIETPESTAVETVKDHDYSSDDTKQDIMSDVTVNVNDQPKPTPILPMRSSDHPILQDIVAKINKSIETPKQPIIVPNKYSNLEDNANSTIGGTNAQENTIAVVEEPVDATEDIEKEVTEYVEIAKIPEAVDLSDDAAQDTSENLGEIPHKTDNEPDSSLRGDDVGTQHMETAADDGSNHPSDYVDNELPDCDLLTAVLDWYSTNSFTQLEGLKLLMSDQFTALWNHVLRLLGSDLPLFFIPLSLSLLVTYICLMAIALHMLTASVGNSNVLTMLSLVAEMVFLASLALLDEKISNDRAFVTVLLVYVTSSVTACLSGLDQLTKACPSMSRIMKSSLMILSIVVSLCGILFIVDCESTFSGKVYLSREDATTVQLLCGLRLLPIPTLLARIDCEISRSPTRRVQGVHKIDLALETLKFLLAVQISINPTFSFLQLIMYLSVVVGLHGMQLLLWEVVISSHVTCTAAGLVEEEEVEEEVTEFSEISKLMFSTHVIAADMSAMIYHNTLQEEVGEERDQQTTLIDDGIEIDKTELTFDRGRLHSNRNIVVYINKAPIEEKVLFTSENECKLYLAHMTGSSESLESVLKQVRRDSQKTNSESSNEDYIIIPKIVVECSDYPIELKVDCLCDETGTTSPERRRCRSADSSASHSNTDLTRLDQMTELLSEQEVEEPRCQSSMSSFGNGSCASCRKTKL